MDVAEKKMIHVDLFSGCAGFTLAASRCGMETVAFSEVDASCCKFLEHKYPTIPNLGDVRHVGRKQIKWSVDLVTFGSPCQDLSVAGRRRGFDGERSGLFREAIRICDELKPTIAVWENVPGNLVRRCGAEPNEHVTGTLGAEKKQGDTFPCVAGKSIGIRRLTPRECERLQGFQWRETPHAPRAWQDESGRWWSEDWIPDTFSDSAKYRMLGNSVAVPVVEWILKRIYAKPLQPKTNLPELPVQHHTRDET